MKPLAVIRDKKSLIAFCANHDPEYETYIYAVDETYDLIHPFENEEDAVKFLKHHFKGEEPISDDELVEILNDQIVSILNLEELALWCFKDEVESCEE